ncbi:hypothetical protein LQZ21_09955 [Treponema sp. TIM-1]|uniref:hypothetical protein n=1 Tax=Treponema sp. TIM-1 TaxID=2898417 RepID=UPI0039807557
MPGHIPGTLGHTAGANVGMPGTGTEGPPLPPEEVLARLALSLGLPREDLSTALLGFVRYFSLPLEPGLFHRLRREALHPSPKAGGEALALAAAAAAAKGLSLTGEALEAYAAALDPGYREPPEGDPGGGQNSGERRQDNPPEPEDIKKAAEESEAASPLLRIVNRLPGKNRERWVVLPFNFLSGGVACKVSLRILLKSRGSYGYEAERFALDISLDPRRWLFVLDRSQETAPRLDVYVTPLPEGKSPLVLERELTEILGDIWGNISVKISEKMPFFADSRDETLLSVNEEV